MDKEWKEGDLEDYSSDVYTPSTETGERSDEEVRRFRAENQIAIVSGEEKAPKPTLEFDEVGFPEEIIGVLGVSELMIYTNYRILLYYSAIHPVCRNVLLQS